MDEFSEKELEQILRLDLFRKQAIVIFKRHAPMISLIFVLFLSALLTLLYLRVTLSASRYVARVSLHYYPKQPGKIQPYEERFLLQLFNRPALRKKFFNALNAGEFGNLRPSGAVQLSVEKKRNSSFAIVVHARTEQEAVEFTNAYARLCLQEYADKRSVDLKQWENVLLNKKNDVFNQLQEIARNKAQLMAPLQVISPEKDFERFRLRLADHQAAYATLSFVVENLKERQKVLQEEIGEINPMLLKQSSVIREQAAELKRLDREISIAQELYTEENPKLMQLLSRRQAIREKFDEFLTANGLSLNETSDLESAEKRHTELNSVQNELKAKEEELRVLQNELENDKKTVETLTRIMPRCRELDQESLSLRDSLKKLDESLADINYLLVLVKDDLFITESAMSAVGQRPFRKKNLAIVIFSTFALSAFAASILVLLDLVFGRVDEEAEMTFRPELRYLGKLPINGNLLKSNAVKEMLFNSICHRMQNAVPDAHVILVGALPGGKILPEFFSALEWNYVMSSKRFLVVNIVLACNVDETLPESDDTGIVVYSGDKGYLPIASKKYIAPTEMELLKQDLTVLRQKYDVILFRHAFAFRHSQIFLEQFIPLCDSLLIAVGLHKTPRQNLRTLAEMQRDTQLPILTVLIDRTAKHFDKIMENGE